LTDLLLSPPVALILFLGVGYGLYRLGGRIAARSEESAEKRLPYTGGEELPPQARQLSYHAFFRLALMFGILHVAALVVSTLPARFPTRRTALFYLVGVGVSVFVLTDSGDTEEDL
jgi:NADH:ubiquinone oxidoreductase subunit 3 (subunit A)